MNDDKIVYLKEELLHKGEDGGKGLREVSIGFCEPFLTVREKERYVLVQNREDIVGDEGSEGLREESVSCI